MAWSVENFQFVVFTQPSDVLDAYPVWTEVFGSSPDGYQRLPDPQQKTSTANGTYAGIGFQVQCQPGRIDLLLVGLNTDAPFPMVANPNEALKVLRQLAMKLASSKPTTRLALVSILFQNCKSLPEANRLFSELTRQTSVPAGASDLIFGLNMRKQYVSDGFVVNRLMRWSSLVKQMINIQVTGSAQEMLPVEQPAVVLNLDVNTVPRPTPIKISTLKDVVNALFAEHDQLKGEGYGALVR